MEECFQKLTQSSCLATLKWAPSVYMLEPGTDSSKIIRKVETLDIRID